MSDEGDEEKKKGSNLTVMTGSAIAPPRAPSAKVIEAEKLRNRVHELRDRMTEDYFEIGRLLYYIQQRGIYRLWEGPDDRPYETFSDYVEHEVAFIGGGGEDTFEQGDGFLCGVAEAFLSA